MKKIKFIITILVIVIMLSCSNKQESNGANKYTPEASVTDTKTSLTEAELMDEKGDAEKAEYLESENINSENWKDLACGVCGRRCCVNCTANGNPGSCAQTRFSKCSVCNHDSASHYPVNH